jgi:hypothetical protein
MWTADRFKRWGSSVGAMHVEVAGNGRDGKRMARRWTLIAINGDGPFVPTLAASALVRLLMRDQLRIRGAWPCVGLLKLDDILAGARNLAVRTQVERW